MTRFKLNFNPPFHGTETACPDRILVGRFFITFGKAYLVTILNTVKVSIPSTFIFLGDTDVIPMHIVMLLDRRSHKLLKM
jgi:hypothetical protein